MKLLKVIKILLILIAFVFLLTGCTGKVEEKNVPEKIVKKPVSAKKVVKEIVREETREDEDLEMDFKDEEKDEEAELAKDFEDKEDDLEEKNETDIDADDNGAAGRIKRVTVQPEIIRGDSDIKIFVQLIPGLSSNESILINFRKSGTIEIANTGNTVFKKNLFKKGDPVSFDIMLIKNENIIEEKRSPIIIVANSNPKITQMPSISTSGYKVYTYDVKAEDIDGDSITFELTGDVPPGMQIDGFTGRITYNFNSPPPNEKYVFNVIARDSDGGEDIREVSLSFKIKTVNPD